MKSKKYGQYTPTTQKFMTEVEKYLINKYTKIESHWEGQLQLLAANYDLF